MPTATPVITAASDLPPAANIGAPPPDYPVRKIFDVKIVDQPLPAVSLLSTLQEPSTTDCTAALVRHAELLGANYLFVDRQAADCRGAAYLMQASSETRSDAPPEDYGNTLRLWLLDRWHRPDGVSDDDLARMCVVTRFWTTSTLRIWKVLIQPVRSSGNTAFDESVRMALESAIDEHAAIPEPAAVHIRRNVRNAVITLAFSTSRSAGCR